MTNTSPPNNANYDHSRNRNPPPSEVREMTQRAQLVLDLVERIRGVKGSVDARGREWETGDSKRARFKDPIYPGTGPSTTSLQSPRGLSGIGTYVYDDLDPEARSEAERDMLTIRSKRSAAAAVAAANASVNTGGNNNGQSAGTSGMGGDKLAKKTRKRGVRHQFCQTLCFYDIILEDPSSGKVPFLQHSGDTRVEKRPGRCPDAL